MAKRWRRHRLCRGREVNGNMILSFTSTRKTSQKGSHAQACRGACAHAEGKLFTVPLSRKTALLSTFVLCSRLYCSYRRRIAGARAVVADKALSRANSWWRACEGPARFAPVLHGPCTWAARPKAMRRGQRPGLASRPARQPFAQRSFLRHLEGIAPHLLLAGAFLRTMTLFHVRFATSLFLYKYVGYHNCHCMVTWLAEDLRIRQRPMTTNEVPEI